MPNRRRASRVRSALARFWALLRAVSGDSAYEVYRRRPDAAPVSREAFYLEGLRRKYSGPSRCC